MKKSRYGLILIGLMVSAGSVSAASLDKLAPGQAAFNAGDYTRSFSLWSTLATQGDAEAQVFVGLSYDNGWGTPKSARLARVWYQKAANKNNSVGQYLLGLHFIQGSDEDRAKGLMWLQRAASNGDSSAQKFLEKGQQRGWFRGITPVTAPDIPEKGPAPGAKPEAPSATPQTVALAQ